MIAKRIQPAVWFRDEPLSHLLHVHSRGMSMDKLAASDSPLLQAEIKPEKGHAFVHVVTTGAGELYGANNNADYFNKSAALFHFPHPVCRTRSLLRSVLVPRPPIV